MKLHISASSLSRSEKCPYSASGPRVRVLHADAEKGTEEHAALEAETPEGERAEVAYVWNVLTSKVRFVGIGLARNYGELQEGDIPGTLDNERVESGRVVVKDHKTGFGYMVAPVAVNLQLAHNAVCSAAFHGKRAALVQINRTSREKPEEAELDAIGLAAARSRLANIWRAASAEKPAVVAGDHCWRCECIQSCPAHVGMALAFTDGKWPDMLPSDGLTVEKVAQGWEHLRAAKKVLGLVEKTYRAFASSWPVPLASGKVLGETTSEVDVLDGQISLAVLRQLHGDKVAEAAIELSLTKASIERAVAPIAPPRGKAKLVRDSLAAIETAGGVKTIRKVCVEEFNPNQEK